MPRPSHPPVIRRRPASLIPAADPRYGAGVTSPGPARPAQLAGRILDRLGARPADGHRYVVGIAGPPGAGKSTLAARLVTALNHAAGDGFAGLAPMDGFHLPNATLRARNALARKGEPDTFDAAGYVAALRRVRDTPLGVPVPWPTFDRALDEPTPGGAVFTGHTVVITEGNYLLLDEAEAPGWSGVRALLDETWYVDADRSRLTERLLARHRAGGRDPEAALRKVRDSDLRNAELVAASRPRAQLVLVADGDGYRISAP